MASVTLQDLSKRFEKVTAVNQVNLPQEQGRQFQFQAHVLEQAPGRIRGGGAPAGEICAP